MSFRGAFTRLPRDLTISKKLQDSKPWGNPSQQIRNLSLEHMNMISWSYPWPQFLEKGPKNHETKTSQISPPSSQLKKTGVESSKMLWGVDMTTQPRDPQRTLPILGVDSVSCMKCSAPKKNNHQVLPSDPFGSFFLWPFQGWLVTSIWGIKGSLLSLLSSQLMVTCCFGACWFGILISPKMEGIGILGGTMIESQTTGPPNQQLYNQKNKKKKKKNKHFLVPGSFLGQTRCVFLHPKKSWQKMCWGWKIRCKGNNLKGPVEVSIYLSPLEV